MTLSAAPNPNPNPQHDTALLPPGKSVGFLADARRLNVAVTRAKRHVAVICDAECCGSDAFIGRLLRHIEDRGEYRSALELDMQPDGGSLEEVTAAAMVDVAAARESGSASGNATGGRGRAKSENEGAEGKLSDADVLKRVHEFAQRKPPKKTAEEEGEMEEELPSELTARQRALVHETAERLGLGHASRGEGRRRAVVLRKVEGGDDGAGTVVEEGGGESSYLAADHNSNRSSSSSSSSSSGSGSSEATGDVGESQFSVLTGGEGSEEDKDDADDEADDSGDGDAARATQEARAQALTTAKTAPPAGSRTPGPNSLLAALHAELAARRPAAPPPPPRAGKKKGGKGGKTAAGAGGQGGGGSSAAAGPDDRGFGIDVPHGGGSGTGAKKSANRKGASSSKKGKKKTGGAGGGAAGARAAVDGRAGGGKSNRGSAKASGKGLPSGGGGGGCNDEDDDMLFLDAQIRKERAAEPCYASLLRRTTEAMREHNPRWAAAEDNPKPSKSVITGARRTQLKGALETKLTEKEKKRSKSAAEKGKKS